MARVKMVTREFKLTVVECMVFDFIGKNTSIQEFTIGGEFETNEDILKKLNKILSKDNFQALTIESKDVKVELRGMLEEDFIKMSMLLDNETRKPIE